MPDTERDDQPVIAVDLGATTTRVALFGTGGALVKKVASPTPATGDSPEIVTRHLAGLIRKSTSPERGPCPGCNRDLGMRPH